MTEDSINDASPSLQKVAGQLQNACQESGKQQISGIRIELANPGHLDVRDGDFDEHVSMQPAAIAYFGACRKEAGRALDTVKSEQDIWKKKKFQDAKSAIAEEGNKKPTMAEIDSWIIRNYEDEYREWNKEIIEAQHMVDLYDSWYEAWKQKSFALKEHGQSISDEKRTSPYMLEKPSSGDNREVSTPVGTGAMDKMKRIANQGNKNS